MSIRRSTCLRPTAGPRRAQDAGRGHPPAPVARAGVNKVDIIGERPEKIFIEFSHAKLATLGVTPQQIFDSVAKQNAVVSGGSVDTSADRINLRVTGAFSGVDAIARVPVQAERARFGSATSPRSSAAMKTRRASSCARAANPRSVLGVSMQDGANIITLGRISSAP
jgi:multidrug efflux pump subunit AcrB